MEGIAIALIGLAGNIGGVLLNNHLSNRDRKANNIFVRVGHTIEHRLFEEIQTIRKSALFGFIFGIAAVFLGGFFSIAGIISAKQALRDIGFPDNDPRSVWFAKAGLKMGYLGIIELIILITVFITLKISSSIH